MLQKIGYVADFEGRSINSQILVLIRQSIEDFEKANGKIDSAIAPEQNVKPAKKG